MSEYEKWANGDGAALVSAMIQYGLTPDVAEDALETAFMAGQRNGVRMVSQAMRDMQGQPASLKRQAS